MELQGDFLKPEVTSELLRSQTSVPPRDNEVWKTPMFEQYWKIRESLENLSNVVLFYRMGDFYELFGQDAVTAAPVLSVLLTARHKDADLPVPMCGVPGHAVDTYIERLLAKNIKVAVCEQIAGGDLDSGQKTKLIERKIVRILTPGLLPHIDNSSIEISYLLVFRKCGTGAEICLFDFLGQKSFVGVIQGTEELKSLFLRHRFSEILVSPGDKTYLEKLLKGTTYFEKLERLLTFWPQEDSAENLLESYLRFTQRKEHFPFEKLSLERFELFQKKGFATLMPEVLEQWNIHSELVDFLQGSASVLGARRLRSLLTRPLKDVNRIHARQSFYSYILRGPRSQFLTQATDVYDLEKLLGRIQMGAAKPKELLRFEMSLKAVLAALKSYDLQHADFLRLEKFEELAPLHQVVETAARLSAELGQKLQSDLDPHEMGQKNEDLSIYLKSGFDSKLDELKEVAEKSEAALSEFEARLRSETQIGSLKVRQNKVFGFYIEVTKTHISKVPETFIRKQTTVGGERFTHPELQKMEVHIEQSEKQLQELSHKILEELLKSIQRHAPILRQLFEGFSFFEAFVGVARKLDGQPHGKKWVLPKVVEGDFFFEISEGRHPLVEKLLGYQKEFVPQTLALGRPVSSKRLLLLTGPNMAGKSTLMRLIGIHLFLAQAGFPVPAKSMSLAPAHSFFSRMGAQDRILSGESTFMVEMTECAQILKNANSQSFVLIDELGRGTSTEDGLALASAVIEFLHDETQSLTLFATHFHELSEKGITLQNLQNASMAIQEWKGELIFLRRLEMKPAESSYGLFVARLAGVQNKVIKRAAELLPQIQSKTVSRDMRLPLFSNEPQESHIEKQIETLDMDELSPRKAWELLAELQKKIKDVSSSY
jgi:DNA mismatch repair protein MutS